MEIPERDLAPEESGAPQRDGGGDEKSAAPQSNCAVRVEVVSQESNVAGGEKMVAPEGSGAGAERGAAPETNGVGAEEGVAVAAGPQMQGDMWTCHQCRQRKTEITAACKMIKKKGKCPLKYCKKCMLNRYAEIAEKVAKEEAWTCPKCRGVCNCSMCRKRKGEAPTGPIVRAAKASGCSSAHHLLNKGPDAVAAAQKLIALLKVNDTKKGNPKRALGTDHDTGELPVEGDDLHAVSSVPAIKKPKGNCRVNNSPADEKSLLRIERPDALEDEIVLPRGTLVTSIAGAECLFGEVVMESK